MSTAEVRAAADTEDHGQHTGRPPGGNRARLVDVAVLLLPLVVAIRVTVPLSDPDLWWHLRTGELILRDGLVERDPWSFATRHPWLLHEWLSEVALHGAHTAAGMAGVVVLQSLVIGLFALVVLLTCRRVSGPELAGIATVLVVVATLPGFGTRPQLISWVLLAAVCPYLRRSVAARRLPWLLPPLVWLWANLHGLWFTALALYGALVLGLLFEEGRAGWRTTARMTMLGLATAVAAGSTPNGPAILLGPLRVSEYARFVTEWDPPDISRPGAAAALLLVGTVVVSWARSPHRIPATDILFVALATAIGLRYSRTVPVMAIAVAPLAAEALQRAAGLSVPPLALGRRARALLALATAIGLAAVVVLARAAAVPDPAQAVPGTSSRALSAASAKLDALPGRARVLTEYELGGWLIWSARDTSPAVDGRAELYPVEYLERYLESLGMRPGWREFVTDLDVDAALLLAETPLSEGLRTAGWSVVFDEDGLLILLPPAGTTQ